MGEASVPVDVLNPGQVFACFGLLEAATDLLGDGEGGFDWSDPTQTRFRLRACGEGSPVEAVLGFLDEAKAIAIAPAGGRNAWRREWGERRTEAAGAPYPFPEPSSPATLVCLLEAGARRVRIDHWGDATRRDNMKFWGGSAGKPGVAFANDALGLVRGACLRAAADPFSVGRPQSGSFRFDWRRDYIPIDTGFSRNEHSDMVPVGFPLVELLAAIGLTHARPERLQKLRYRYALIGCPEGGGLLPASLLRASLGGVRMPFPTRRFTMNLGYPGKEGQARAITTVNEEP